MKDIAIIIFDDFTDIDLFLIWDILGRNKTDWTVRILGNKNEHRSTHGLLIPTHGHIKEANNADVVLFSSGRIGVKNAIQNREFLASFSLNPEKQIIGSVCAGAFILHALGILDFGIATTHPDAKVELSNLGIKVLDQPLVCCGNIATAGGCLAAQYLIGWFVECLFGVEKRKETLLPILPAGQIEIYEQLIADSIKQGITVCN